MNEEFASKTDINATWIAAEQWFMRFIGASLIIIAILSVIFGFFPNRENLNFISGINIVTILIFGIGSIWSFWWSNETSRIHNMVEGFIKNGAGRTYAFAILQGLVGILFAFELMGGSLPMGLVGALMLVSCGFFIWRAQQISTYQ